MEQAHARVLRKSARSVLFGSSAVALLTFFCFQVHVDFASAIPLYLLVVVLQSLTGDFRSSAIVASLSAGCLDFFFTEPLFSFRMTNPLNGLALVAFLVTALVITRLVSRVRTEAEFSRLQEERLNRLYQLSQRLLTLEPEMAMAEKLLPPFSELFGITVMSIFDAAAGELFTFGDSQTSLAERTREAYIHEHDLDDRDSGTAIRCLRAGGKLTGAIGLEGIQDTAETASALAALAATFFERARAFANASTAAAAAQTESYRSAVLDALAHEFKTPLATILAAAGGLRETGPLAAEQLELADTVESEAARLGRLTTRLLRIAKLEREDIRPRLELVDIASLVTQIAGRYSARFPDRRIQLPGRSDIPEVLADPELLRLTLGQLIENAYKYSHADSLVTIGIERLDGFVAVRVSNNGSSIPYEEQNRIFERFYRGADAIRSTTGSGLGLYVARKIALAHGGTLELESRRAANDVIFCLKLPVSKDESSYALTAN